MRKLSSLMALSFVFTLVGCAIVMPNSSQNTSQNEVVVSNPVITSFTANPTSLRMGDKLTLSVEAVSSSGKTLTYIWSSTGGTLSATGGKIIYWTAPSSQGTYTIQVSVTDGIGGQAAGSLNVVVGSSGDVSVNQPVITNPGNTQNSTAQWSKISSVSSCLDIYFANPTLGWIIETNNSASTIKHTTDAGSTWSIQWNTPQILNTIFFMGTNNGWAGGNGGTLLKTIDEGKNWELVDWPGAGKETIYSIRFEDLANGLLLTDQSLYQTIDGGSTWTKAAEQISGSSWEEGILSYSQGKALIDAYDSNYSHYLYSYGSGSLTKLGEPLSSVSFTDSLSGWGTTKESLFKTTDGGNNWNKLDKLNLKTEFKPLYYGGFIAFTSPLEGVFLSYDYDCAFLTHDGGNTWVKKDFPWTDPFTGTNNPYSAFVFDQSHLWVKAGQELYKLAP